MDDGHSHVQKTLMAFQPLRLMGLLNVLRQ